MARLTVTATVARLRALAARQDGRLAAEDVEHDEALGLDRETTSAAGRLLAAETTVSAEPADEQADGWFPYAELQIPPPEAE